MTYPPQPPPNPYGQQYPPQPYPQQQQPYPQQPYYGQQPPGMYPGGMPPGPPKKGNGGIIALVIGIIALVVLGGFGLVLWLAVSVGGPTASSHTTLAPTTAAASSTTASSSAAPTTTAKAGGSAGAGEASPQQLLTDYVNAVNGKTPNDVVAMICPAEKDKLAPSITDGSSVFAPDAQVIASPGQVTQSAADTASGAGHYSGIVKGQPFDKDFTLPMKQLSGSWFLCSN